MEHAAAISRNGPHSDTAVVCPEFVTDHDAHCKQFDINFTVRICEPVVKSESNTNSIANHVDESSCHVQSYSNINWNQNS